MKGKGLVGIAMIVACGVCGPAFAQQQPPPPQQEAPAQVPTPVAAGAVTPQTPAPPSPPGAPVDPVLARHQIYMMEGILQRAVELGAAMLNRRMNAVMPNLLTMTGNARARGFRLDGYGVFFDVEIPGVRQSVAWSLRVLDNNDVGARGALQSVRKHVRGLSDPQAKREVEDALDRLSKIVALTNNDPSMAVQDGNGGTVPTAALASMPDPNEAYTAEVKNALIDAMLDHSAALVIGRDEWVTIAARDNAGPLPGEPIDISTVVLRVKGTDLMDFRAGRITRDQARNKVEVREF